MALFSRRHRNFGYFLISIFVSSRNAETKRLHGRLGYNRYLFIYLIIYLFSINTFLQGGQSASDGVQQRWRWTNVANLSSTWTKLHKIKVCLWRSWNVLREAHMTIVLPRSKKIRLTSWHWTEDACMRQVQISKWKKISSFLLCSFHKILCLLNTALNKNFSLMRFFVL